jgi:cell division protein FtsZ
MTFDFSHSRPGQSSGYQPGSTYKFEIPRTNRSIIKVVGVGGGGSNAVNHMFRMGIKDVEFIVCNTDLQALHSSPVPIKLQIGEAITEGLGCGANPEVGRAAAIESHERIREALNGAKMVFITAGMGGGTGTGAAPEIAKIAREMGILTVGIVTMPFEWEGKKKVAQANAGVSGLKENSDTVLVILNRRLREMFGNLAISQAFAEADNVLTTAAKGIAEIITLAGYVNVDFQDVRTVMHDAGAAVMGSAETSGEDRAINAAKMALSSPLLDNKDIMGAKKILLSIISGDTAELQMDELTVITNYIQEQAGDRCEVIFGHGVDPMMGDKIRVTVIATGFHDNRKRVKKEQPIIHHLDRPVQTTAEPDNSLNQPPQEITVRPAKPNEHISGKSEPKKPEVKSPSKDAESDEFVPVNKPGNRLGEPEKGFTLDLFNSDNAYSESKSHAEYDDFDTYGYDHTEESSAADQTQQHIINADLERTQQRLAEQARVRREKLAAKGTTEMTKDEFEVKWKQPAYLRKGVKMENTPHSSQTQISKYNLNDDNSLLGNNRYLHDNVD